MMQSKRLAKLAAGNIVLALLAASLLIDKIHTLQNSEILESFPQRPPKVDVDPFYYAAENGKWVYGGGKHGFGPYFYGDTNVYGAQLTRDGHNVPFPKYYDLDIDQATGQDVPVLSKPAGYDSAFLKDYYSYFSPQDIGVDSSPNPIEAGYWPYTTPDGLLATGEPGETGRLLRSFQQADSLDGQAPTGSEEASGDNAERDAYLKAEASVYENDLRFYTEDDWP